MRTEGGWRLGAESGASALANPAYPRWRDWLKCVGENGENYIDANTARPTWAAARALSPSWCLARFRERLSCRVDLSPRMAEAARTLGGRAEVLLCDAERLPFRDGSFDAAWCNDSFHHYPDPERTAFQAWRAFSLEARS